MHVCVCVYTCSAEYWRKIDSNHRSWGMERWGAALLVTYLFHWAPRTGTGRKRAVNYFKPGTHLNLQRMPQMPKWECSQGGGLSSLFLRYCSTRWFHSYKPPWNESPSLTGSYNPSPLNRYVKWPDWFPREMKSSKRREVWVGEWLKGDVNICKPHSLPYWLYESFPKSVVSGCLYQS